ncbi:hypothetical protein ABT237_22280 [Streptomyces sp. NPDC001581]|uniref:hypothetical protein n=1 Tax=Streptomyces sp. NPDC001581 TaxID=3154386 RepID=UPI00331CDCCA
MNRFAGAVATYAEQRITPLLASATKSHLVRAVCWVEAAAYAGDGFTVSDRRVPCLVGTSRLSRKSAG